ncbi:MAG: DUF896 domain-containing protein [Bacillota bacterium]|nr:DUF896 domain-containing protein [Bacillota bacterium]
MDKNLIDRINELAHKKKAEGLTEEEQLEQASLRAQYLEQFRKNFRAQLDNVRFVEDLSEEELAAMQREKSRRNS